MFQGHAIWAMACDFHQCGILTSVYSDGPMQPPFKLRTSKRCLVSSLTIIEYSSDKQSLWSDCAYVQADLRLCWSHIPHCWKSYALAHIWVRVISKSAVIKYGPERVYLKYQIHIRLDIFCTLLLHSCYQISIKDSNYKLVCSCKQSWKQCGSWSAGFSDASWSGSILFWK